MSSRDWADSFISPHKLQLPLVDGMISCFLFYLIFLSNFTVFNVTWNYHSLVGFRLRRGGDAKEKEKEDAEKEKESSANTNALQQDLLSDLRIMSASSPHFVRTYFL